MREEIEAAALFITRLVNKNLSQSNSAACSSSASSTHSSSSSSSSSSSTSSESPPGFDEQTTTTTTNGANDQDKVEQFRQCLTKALYERFHNHWFPEQPAKGQAYRCIRLNEWDRHDITLQKACLQCGIDYKDLQLPVELTLWVDPEEVTCRFGENKGSHCLVAKFKDGELKDNNFNIDDISNIDIEIFRQTATERMRQASLHGSPDYHKHQHQHNQHNNMNNSNNNNVSHNGSYHFHQHNIHNNHHHQQHNHHHQTQQQQQSHHQQQQQTPPLQHHQRSNLGKPAILPSYHHNYLNGCDNNGNPIYYYF